MRPVRGGGARWNACCGWAMLGPGKNWWPINKQEEKVAGRFTTTAGTRARGSIRWNAKKSPVVNQWEGAMKMIVRTLVILLAIVATGIPAGAQSTSPVVGTWRVVSYDREVVETKAISHGFGGNPMGLVTYTPDGRMMLMIVDATRLQARIR